MKHCHGTLARFTHYLSFLHDTDSIQVHYTMPIIGTDVGAGACLWLIHNTVVHDTGYSGSQRTMKTLGMISHAWRKDTTLAPPTAPPPSSSPPHHWFHCIITQHWLICPSCIAPRRHAVMVTGSGTGFGFLSTKSPSTGYMKVLYILKIWFKNFCESGNPIWDGKKRRLGGREIQL